MKNRKRKISLALLILIVCITLGYAAIRTGLNINGLVDIPNVSWEVYFDNYQKSASTNVTPTTEPSIPAGEKPTTISYVVDLDEPGDIYEFTVDVVNGGTIDAMIESISSKLNGVEIDSEHPVPSYLNYSITYADDVVIQPNFVLKHNTHETYKVRLEYKEDLDPEDLPTTGQQLRFDLTVVYTKDDGSSVDPRIPAPANFSTDSWETIVYAVKKNNTSVYNVGDTKTVDLGSLGTHTLRIANKSTPSECSTTGFSQTACGFVLEFADIVTSRQMNSNDTNTGGWPATKLRTYINSTMYDALPTELKEAIKNTKVVSGHGTNDSANFTSTDKLYLLSSKEVYGKDGTSRVVDVDTAEAETRQLDYYHAQGVTTSNARGASKQADAYWWLRTAYGSSGSSFFHIDNYGDWSGYSAFVTLGVSPAFRLGK